MSNIFHKFPGKFQDSEGIQGVVERAQVTVSSAQLLALHTTPQTLVAAPGTGKYIQVLSVAGKIDAGTAYTGSNAVEVRYTNGSGAKATGDLAAAWLNSASDRVDVAVGAAVTAVANAAVVAVVPTADPAAGTGTVVFDVLYRVVPLA
jgi:hypothetical protein